MIHEFEGRSDPLIIVRKEIPFLLTRNATAIIHSRLKSDGTWEFTDDTNKPLELLRALGSNARVWTVREP